MLSSISTVEDDSDGLISQTFLALTQTLARHAELLGMAMTTQSRMETLWQEGSSAQGDPDLMFAERMKYGAQSYLQRLETSFGHVAGNLLLLISPEVFPAYQSLLTGSMLSLTTCTTDQQEAMHASALKHCQNLRVGAGDLMIRWMDNEVSMSPSLGSSAGPTGDLPEASLLSLAFARLTRIQAEANRLFSGVLPGLERPLGHDHWVPISILEDYSAVEQHLPEEPLPITLFSTISEEESSSSQDSRIGLDASPASW